MRSASPASAETGSVPAGAASAGTDGGASSPVSGACSLLRAHHPDLVRLPADERAGDGCAVRGGRGRDEQRAAEQRGGEQNGGQRGKACAMAHGWSLRELQVRDQRHKHAPGYAGPESVFDDVAEPGHRGLPVASGRLGERSVEVQHGEPVDPGPAHDVGAGTPLGRQVAHLDQLVEDRR